jgi:hypothetical protein
MLDNKGRVPAPETEAAQGEKVGTVKRRAGSDQRVVTRHLEAKVEPFFLVGLPRRQLIADTKLSAPSPPA